MGETRWRGWKCKSWLDFDAWIRNLHLDGVDDSLTHAIIACFIFWNATAGTWFLEWWQLCLPFWDGSPTWLARRTLRSVVLPLRPSPTLLPWSCAFCSLWRRRNSSKSRMSFCASRRPLKPCTRNRNTTNKTRENTVWEYFCYLLINNIMHFVWTKQCNQQIICFFTRSCCSIRLPCRKGRTFTPVVYCIQSVQLAHLTKSVCEWKLFY